MAQISLQAERRFLLPALGVSDNRRRTDRLTAKRGFFGESGSFKFFAVGVNGANMDVLRQISVSEPLTLPELRFRDLFSWLSHSLGAVSLSSPGDTVPLAKPVTPRGWASIG